LDSLIEQIKTTLFTSGKQSAVEADNELLHDASAMLTSEIATQISEALSHNPSAKDRLLHPLFVELMAMEAKKYGWDSGVPVNHYAQLLSAISQNGVSPNKSSNTTGGKIQGGSISSTYCNPWWGLVDSSRTFFREEGAYTSLTAVAYLLFESLNEMTKSCVSSLLV